MPKAIEDNLARSERRNDDCGAVWQERDNARSGNRRKAGQEFTAVGLHASTSIF
jgi:hypothetical protein